MAIQALLMAIPNMISIRVEKDVNKRKQEIEYQPYLDHLHVRGLRESFNHCYEHAGEHQHYCQIDSQGRFEEEWFKVVRYVPDNIQ